MKFKRNDHITILPYKNDRYNCVGRINQVDTVNKQYHVTNMNMPFMGTVSEWFKENQLAKLSSN